VRMEEDFHKTQFYTQGGSSDGVPDPFVESTFVSLI
jgi:hypothetical protein